MFLALSPYHTSLECCNELKLVFRTKAASQLCSLSEQMVGHNAMFNSQCFINVIEFCNLVFFLLLFKQFMDNNLHFIGQLDQKVCQPL